MGRRQHEGFWKCARHRSEWELSENQPDIVRTGQSNATCELAMTRAAMGYIGMLWGAPPGNVAYTHSDEMTILMFPHKMGRRFDLQRSWVTITKDMCEQSACHVTVERVGFVISLA